jgi:hypothetical protein
MSTENLERREFSFLLHTCNLGEKTRTGVNPFTKETIHFPIDDGLSDSESDAVLEILESHGFEEPEEEGEGYVLSWSDRECLQLRSGAFEPIAEGISSVEVELLSVGTIPDQVLAIILEIAIAGNLALMSPTGEDVRVPAKAKLPQVLKRWPDAAVIETVDELRAWLTDTIEGRPVYG